jgi:hypothetical protein
MSISLNDSASQIATDSSAIPTPTDLAVRRKPRGKSTWVWTQFTVSRLKAT